MLTESSIFPHILKCTQVPIQLILKWEKEKNLFVLEPVKKKKKKNQSVHRGKLDN